MKIFIQSPDARGQIDGSVQKGLLAHFPEQVASCALADVVVIPVSTYANFEFNPQLHSIPGNKPVVIVDFCEMEWNYCDLASETHLFGKNTRECRWFAPNWYPFCDWVKEHPPAVYFVRENFAKDMTQTVRPVEWPAYLDEPPLQSEAEFNARPLEVINLWGYSNPVRPRLHGDIFHAMNRGIGVISDPEQFTEHFKHNPPAHPWMSVFIPWQVRRPIADLRPFMERAKINVSLPGAGVVCFRSTESCVDSIMALQFDNREWSIPWIDGDNCIRLRPGHEFEDLEGATRRSDLYQIYLAGRATAARYRGPRYVNEYMLPIMERAI